MPVRSLYSCCASDLVTRVLDGYNATILAYGQTGAGNTHTMTGPGTSPNFALRGIIPRAIAQVYMYMYMYMHVLCMHTCIHKRRVVPRAIAQMYLYAYISIMKNVF
jgi:KaiC/GvpD/RAD55 family RecA-like ATPase